MDDAVKHLADAALGCILPRYGLQCNDLRAIGHAGSDVREFWRDGARYVLRLQQCNDREIDLLRGEIHWISHLSANGVSVSTAVPSGTGTLIEETEVGGVRFAAVVFRAAEGRPPVDFVDEWDDEFYRQWGNLVGRMHEVSGSYTPPSERYARPHWYQTDDVAVEKYAPAGDAGVLRSSAIILERLRQLPADPQSYGLIHADLHRGNFFVKDGVFTVFDFGTCQYCWFTYDVAVSLYHAIFSTPKGVDEKDFGEHFLHQFMLGYDEANSACEVWLDKISLFLKLRRIVMYVDMVRYWDLGKLSPERAHFLERHRRGIQADAPVL